VKLLACGGRDYADRAKVFAVLDAIHKETPIAIVIHGAQTGADLLAEAWAKSRKVPYAGHPADFGRLGPSAGPRRNRKMLSWKPALVVAFPGGRGTAHMVGIAKQAGKEVREIQ